MKTAYLFFALFLLGCLAIITILVSPFILVVAVIRKMLKQRKVGGKTIIK